jgi:D-ribose pyranase
VRHTNTLVIADRGFPFWPQIETIDLSLTDDIPSVFDVLRALQPNFIIGNAWMAAEFREHNPATLIDEGRSGFRISAWLRAKFRGRR